MDGQSVDQIRAQDPELWQSPEDLEDLKRVYFAAHYKRPNYLEQGSGFVTPCDRDTNRLRAQLELVDGRNKRGKERVDPMLVRNLECMLLARSGQIFEPKSWEAVISHEEEPRTRRETASYQHPTRYSGYAETMASWTKTKGRTEDMGSVFVSVWLMRYGVSE